MRDEPDRFGWVGGTVDGKYRVDAVVGSGGFGVVYRAHHLGFEQKVALKCLRVPENLTQGEREHFREMFLAEGRLLHQLSRATAGIVQALDLGAAVSPTRQWTPYLVLEWLEGQPLSEILVARRTLGQEAFSLQDAIALLEGVAHRDIKPANLFLAKIGNREVLKILDFGIAKVMAETESVTRAFEETGASLQAFTARYGAPEQFSRRYGATGPWTDVFALALVLVEAVAGRPAIEGSDAAQLFIQSADPEHRPTFRAFGCEVPDGIENVIKRALAVDPRERFADAGDFWDALESVARESGLPLRLASDPTTGDLPQAQSAPRLPIAGRGEAQGPTELSSSTAVPASSAKPGYKRALLAVALGALILGATAAVVLLQEFSPFADATDSPSAEAPETAAEATPPEARDEPNAEAAPPPGTSAEAAPPPDPSAGAAASAIARRLPLSGAPQRDVPAGSVGDYVMDGFRVLAREATFEKDYRGASDACADVGLTLCTEPQWQRACAAFPELARAPSWTASAVPEGAVVRGGASCDDRAGIPPDEPNAERYGLCCERAIAMTTPNLQKAYLSTTAERILALERVLNQRDMAALAALCEPKVLVDGETKTIDQLARLLGESVKSAPDALVTNEHCEVSVQAQKIKKRVRRKLKTSYQTTGWTAECRQTSLAGASVTARDVAYGFTAVSKLREISTKPAD
jgi:serine/threonine-protein kinase